MIRSDGKYFISTDGTYNASSVSIDFSLTVISGNNAYFGLHIACFTEYYIIMFGHIFIESSALLLDVTINTKNCATPYSKYQVLRVCEFFNEIIFMRVKMANRHKIPLLLSDCQPFVKWC